MLPLSGIRILDFTRHIPGPVATDVLRKLGAEVYKIEPPDGDSARWLPPLVNDHSVLYAFLNSGKRSIAIDLKKEDGQDFARRLAATCDVVVESFRPGVAAQLGIDSETLHRLNPRLVYCSVSAYGAASSRAGHDLNLVALAGLLDLQRGADGTPALPAAQIADLGGGLYAAITILAALIERGERGQGRTIDIALDECARAMMPAAAAMTSTGSRTFPLAAGMPNYNVYETADGGHLAVAALEPRFWARFCEVIGRPDLAPRQFIDSSADEVSATIAQIIRSRTRDEWEFMFGESDCCVEPVLTIAESRARESERANRSDPISSNFPDSEARVEALGESFHHAASELGMGADEISRLQDSSTFRPSSRSRRLLMKAQMVWAQPRN